MWKIVLALLLLLPAMASAQDLDTADQFWFKVRDCLGEKDFTQFYTTEIKAAVNAGLRAIAADIGVIGYDTITIVADQFMYTLNDNFMAKGLSKVPYRAKYVSAKGQTIRGLKITPSEEFGVTSTGTAGAAAVSEVVGCEISGKRLWIYPGAPNGGKIYLEGPIDATPHADSTAEESVVPRADRWGAVYYAVHILAQSRKTPEMQVLATQHKALYDALVIARAGN